MTDTTHGGRHSQIQNTQIHSIYDWLLQRTDCTYDTFRLSVAGYVAGGTTDQWVFDSKVIEYQVNGVPQQFFLPRMTYIGYTQEEMVWIDNFYGALERRLQSGDVAFITSPAMQELTNTPIEDRDIYSLRAPDRVKGGATPGGAKGIGPQTYPFTVQETLVVTEDLHELERQNQIGMPRLKAELVSRVFHEMMHRNWVHSRYAYDDARVPGDPAATIVANLTDEFTSDDMEVLDRVYLETKNTLVALTDDSQLGLSRSEIENVFEDGTSGGALRSAQNYRTQRLWNAIEAALGDPSITFTPEQLELMEGENLIKLRDYPPGLTRDEKREFRRHKENYERDERFIRQLEADRAAQCSNVIFDAVREGGFASVSEAFDAAVDVAREFFAEYSSEIGQAFGSALGRHIARNENQAVQLAVSTTLGVVGENLGEAVELRLRGLTPDASVQRAFEDIGPELKQAGIGAISSYLAAELFEELGLEGTLAELGQSIFGAELTAVITAISEGASVAQALQGVNVANLVGGFVGAKIGAELVEFDTVGGQIGAAIGSAVGTAVGAAAATKGAITGAKVGSIFGPIGAAIGALIGYIVGGMIGSLFGGTPRSAADLGWNENTQQFGVTRVWSKSGGSKDGARSLGESVSNVLNMVITASGARLIDGAAVRTGSYGTHKKNFVYWAQSGEGAGTVTFWTGDVNELINHGTAIAVADLVPQLAGGDVYVKRAVAATVAMAGVDASDNYRGAAGSFDVSILLGNVSTAKDYGDYLRNRNQIDVLLAAEPTSVFAAGWSITFARAIELGLLKRGATDWVGGWNAYMDQQWDGVVDGRGFTPANLNFGFDPANNERIFAFHGAEGELIAVLGDTIDAARKDHMVGTGAADTIVVAGDRIANTSGLTINGQAATGAEHVIEIAAMIDGGAGDDTIVAGDLGNDLVGGDGNDTLIGGKLDDWLLGGAGNDRLFAGAANSQFTDGDVTATAAALDTESNGGLLDGGAGDDALHGSRGSDWLRGGDGVDWLRGGSGGDIVDGGAGNDSGPAGEARLLGGAGTDQYVFGYGSGVDTVFDESDNAATPGVTGDSIYTRLQQIWSGTLARNWAGGGSYEVDGSVRGGEDAIAFGDGIGIDDLILQRSGQDLVVRLTYEVDENTRVETGDQLIIRDWFESTRRVEWLRFADGEEVRIADIQSFIVGSGVSDIIIGTNSADFMYGGAGNDVLFGLAGDDFGFGAAGNDYVAGDDDNDWVAGGLNDDKVFGGAGNDTVFGDSGGDEVNGGAGADIVVGGRGDDVVVGGAGDDIFRYHRGDGRDVVLDNYVNNWELVWQSGNYVNGYVLDTQTGVVTKNGQTYFDGSEWIGQFEYDAPTATFRRHLGAVSGALATNAGTDYLEFGVGIDIQDLAFRRTANDLEIVVRESGDDGSSFDAVADRITIRDWYVTSNSIENFVFASTGRHQLTGWNLTGGTEAAETMTGTSAVDWFTANDGDDTLIGNGGNDILSGNAGADLLRGGAGNDVLYGGANDDTLEGGAGTDTLVGGSGLDIASYANAGTAARNMRAFLDAPQTNTFEGVGDTYFDIEGIEATAGADALGGDASTNVLRGLAGNDTLWGGAGDDIYEINASHGQDTILDQPFVTEEILNVNGLLNTALFTAQWTNTSFDGDLWYYELVVTRNGTSEEVYRSEQYGFVYSSPAASPPPGTSWPSTGWVVPTGLATAPAATGNGNQYARAVFASANGGNDTLEFGPNISLSDLTPQRLNGNADLRITYGTSQFVTITGQSDPNRAIESLQLRDGLTVDLTRVVIVGETASSAGDFVVGNTSANTLDGLAGDDVLSGLAGNDILRGGDGDDVLEGAAGNDTLDGGNDSVTAGLTPSATDQTRAYGDTIRYVRSTAAVTIDLAARTASGGHAAGDIIAAAGGLSSIENVVGSEGYGDTLRGDARANRLVGLAGNDLLDGRAGNDVLVGGLGTDQLYGGDGEDNLAGEDDVDTLEGGNGNDLLAGGAGNDTLRGDAGEDVLSGGDGVDTLYGGADGDQLGGDSGDDQLYGEGGDDTIAGGDGADSLYGGDGNDQLAGGAGNDLLSGELGDDVYYVDVADGSDVVVDTSGRNRLLIGGATREQLWITRSGNDLRIAVIGGASVTTLQGYYAAASPTRAAEIAVVDHSLFLAYAEPLIATMTTLSATTPTTLPTEIADLLATYWHAGGNAMPAVQDQTLTTNEDAPLSGSVVPIDHDENVVSYALDVEALRGIVALNSGTGAWTYTPDANAWGQDWFQIIVTDASNNAAVQTVTVNVASVNDAPSDVLLAGAPSGIEERDRPQQGAALNAIVLGTLSAVDVDAPDPGDYASHAFTVTDSRFEVVSGNVLQLRANAALDFEAGSTVMVAVTARDRNGAGLSYTRNFTFNVLDRDDYFYGTAGNDTITGQAGRNLIYGQGGNDVLNGANANDELDGGDGADDLFGLGGNDLLRGGLGDDDLDGGTGADTLWGGDGTDNLLGQDGDDVLNGEVGLDTLQGGLGNDQLDGGTDPDSLNGGAGDDRLVGGTGDDVLVGGTGADRFLGGAGVDRVSYSAAAAGITVNLATGTGTAGEAAGDIFEDTPEVLEGSAFNDTITGSAGADTLDGGAGNDTIYGGAGNDILNGGAGDDYLDAQWGNDTLNGGIGNDILVGGDDSDTYLMDINSGVDEIRNFDPNGTDIDVVGYQNITNSQLWFERSVNDLIITVVGTTARTTIKDWYTVTTASDRANYKIDFFLSGQHVSDTINAEGLVTLMAGYTRPTTQAQYDALHANPTFENPWTTAWEGNAPPVISSVATQTINEDGTLNLTVRITDDVTPVAGITVTVQAVQPGNPNVVDLAVVNAPTIGTPNGSGDRTLTVTTKPNTSGQVAIKVRATDAGGVTTEQIFLLNVTPVADTPTLPVVSTGTPQSPLTKRTLDSGSWPVNIQGALVDQDGSETLDVRVSNVPTGIGFNTGTNLGGGVWSFGAGPWPTAITGATTWSQDLALTVTAISRETATGLTASTSQALNIEINARPTDISANGALSINENTAAGTTIQSFSRVDADAGDTVTYSLTNNEGGRFAINGAGVLSTGSTLLNYEAATSHTITVLVTDSGGLTRSEDFTVNVNNVNEVPTDISADRTLAFDENTAAGTGLAWFLRADPDAGDTATYSLDNTAGGRFALRNDGWFHAGNTPLNYEAATSHTITVRITDSGGLYRTEDFTVNVNNLNETPSISSTSFNIAEDNWDAPRLPGTVLARVVGSDPEGTTLGWQVVAGDVSLLQINAAGDLVIQEGTLDYEARADHIYSVTVRASDGVNSVDKLITINTQPINEAPRGVDWYYASGWVPHGVWRNAGALIVADPEGGPYTYELGGAVRWWQFTSPNLGNWTEVSSCETISMDTAGNVTALFGIGQGAYGDPESNWWDLEIHFEIRVWDSTGLPSAWIGVTGTPGNFWLDPIWNHPVVLDLDGDGVELVSLSESALTFKSREGVDAARTGWIGADDAMLALDRDGDGALTHYGEISFIDDREGATSDLEGLAEYDTDGDGSFDVDDQRFAEFLVWNDINQDSVSQASELRSLADHGIVAIDLTRNLTGETTFGARDNVMTATSAFTRDDGSKGVVGDVVLASEIAGLPISFESSVTLEPPASDEPAGVTSDGAGAPPDSDSGVPIDRIDRSADSGERANAAASSLDSLDLSPPSSEATGEDRNEQSAVTRDQDRGRGEERVQPTRRTSWRWPDLRESDLAANNNVDAVGGGAAAPSALHAGLSSVVRRRLQMIEAMASFTDEGASQLELQPHRKVDPRTLELLTPVPEIRVA